ACADAQSCSISACKAGMRACATSKGPSCLDPAACQAKCPPTGATATASSTYLTQGPELVLDADDESAWNAGTEAASWLELTFPSPRRLRGVYVLANALPGGIVEH